MDSKSQLCDTGVHFGYTQPIIREYIDGRVEFEAGEPRCWLELSDAARTGRVRIDGKEEIENVLRILLAGAACIDAEMVQRVLDKAPEDLSEFASEEGEQPDEQ